MHFVNNHNLSAVSDAEDFENSSIYSKVMCGATLDKGVQKDTFTEALSRLSDYEITPLEVNFYTEFYSRHSQARCCLPKGHSGKCQHLLSSYYTDNFKNKIADCTQAPGADDVVFKNRTARYYPIQVTNEQETILRDLFKLKQKVKLKAAVPVDQAGTSYTCATAAFDFASLLILQKGNVYKKNFPADVLVKFKEHAEYLVKFYKETYNIRIVNSEGYLCDPWTLETLQPEWWNAKEKSKNRNQIQFCHIIPVCSDKYLTRGLNVIPMTRDTNYQQGDRSFPEFVRLTKEHAAKH
jgi:hypothetical protein